MLAFQFKCHTRRRFNRTLGQGIFKVLLLSLLSGLGCNAGVEGAFLVALR